MKRSIPTMTLILVFFMSSVVSAAADGYTTYVCHNNGESERLALISLGESSNLAIVQMSNFEFSGTYNHDRPRCPSRLCGPENLEIHASVSELNGESIDAMNAFFGFSPSRYIQGEINLYLKNELVKHLDVICRLQ